jgi:hypothetical protein
VAVGVVDVIFGSARPPRSVPALGLIGRVLGREVVVVETLDLGLESST